MSFGTLGVINVIQEIGFLKQMILSKHMFVERRPELHFKQYPLAPQHSRSSLQKYLSKM